MWTRCSCGHVAEAHDFVDVGGNICYEVSAAKTEDGKLRTVCYSDTEHQPKCECKAYDGAEK